MQRSESRLGIQAVCKFGNSELAVVPDAFGFQLACEQHMRYHRVHTDNTRETRDSLFHPTHTLQSAMSSAWSRQGAECLGAPQSQRPLKL